jgi:serine protease AprX
VRNFERPRWRNSLGSVALLLTAALAAPPGSAAEDAAAPEVVPVIVQGASSTVAADAVQRGGGRVDRELALVDGVAARLSTDRVDALVDAGLIVTPDAVLAPTSAPTDGAALAAPHLQLDAVNPGAAWDLDAGAGVGVALIDTGVDAAHPDLQDRVALGPDFSGADGEDAGIDGYGHGTFMAGLIAGNGTASEGHHVGVAPGAHVVSVKVAGRDGLTSLSRVLGAIEWTIEHQDAYDVGVLNLSFGVVNPRTPVDPLIRAVDAAWRSGLTVVAAAGNEGRNVVTSPGWSPAVITTGATDTMGTATPADDTVPAWSGRARVAAVHKPDVLAPGVDVVSMRAAGSTIDPRDPASADAYLTGSGTSMAAAITSGAAAVYLAAHPEATPWAVKRAFVATAVPVSGSTAGAIDLGASLAAGPLVDDADLGIGTHPGHPGAHPSLDRSRSEWNGTRWSGTRWSGTRWSGTRWSGTRWSDLEWNGTRWSGTRWSGTRWSGTRWSGTRWSNVDWNGTRWSGTRWSAESWEAAGT